MLRCRSSACSQRPSSEARDGAFPVLPVDYPVGTPVLATVLAVIPSSGLITLSMKTSRLPHREDLFPPFKVGPDR